MNPNRESSLSIDLRARTKRGAERGSGEQVCDCNTGLAA